MTTYDELAKITINGTILLGRLLACDGHDYSRNHFIFSHIHSDHVGNHLGTCLHNGQVYTSKPTMELLEAITDDMLSRRTQFHTLDYNSPILIEHNNHAEKLRLIESKHILGASQIEVYTEDGKKIVYSGDINSNDVPPDDIDILIIDSTHGTPQFDIPANEESIGRRFIGIVDKAIRGEIKPVLIHASRGILQELMSIVSKENFSKYPILAQKKDIAAAEVYKKYEYPMRYMIDEKSEHGQQIKDDDEWPWIQFTTSSVPSGKERMEEQFGIYFHSYNGGYQMNQQENSVHFLEGSHANYSSLIKYVENAAPKMVLVDNFRTQQGKKLTSILFEKGFNVKCQPV